MNAEGPSFQSGTLPEGTRVYAVGDIHGRLDLLRELAEMMRQDLQRSPAAHVVEVFLGDYVDRGPDSRGVVDWLIDEPRLGDRRICLMGNHEDLLLRALSDPAGLSHWLFNGGGETIVSYVAGENVRSPDFATSEDVRQAFLDALPDSHRAFYESLPRTAELGGYFFVHAGVRPGRPLDAQDPEDLLWIREPFHEAEDDYGKMIVHGHTPVGHQDVRANRINIDTGAVFSGRLTCLVMQGAERRFLETTRRG